MPDPLTQGVDCIHVEVPDLESGLAFYRDSLGHELLWRAETSAGLKMGDGGSELVLNAEPWKWKTDLLVESAESASERFEEAGGSVISGPFDIEIGKAVVVRDPWGTSSSCSMPARAGSPRMPTKTLSASRTTPAKHTRGNLTCHR